MSTILVINGGSSSLKYQLIDVSDERRIASGLVERIGEREAHLIHRREDAPPAAEQQAPTAPPVSLDRTMSIPDHETAFALIAEAFADSGLPLEETALSAVGHRVVQGGSLFRDPTLIDDEVAAQILDLAALAPLHNPGQHAAIQAARRIFPHLPHVAVFDTAFHHSLPEAAATYAIDRALARRYQIRRYGFHGTSHQIVSRRAAQFAGRPLDDAKQIVLHLGNGASATAVLNGQSINTSMGLTPLEGLVMGTRSGDLDPSIVFTLHRVAGLSVDDLDRVLNKQSGLYGLTGKIDMRDVFSDAESGDADAQLALDVYAMRIRHYIGAYLVDLGGLDILTFTGGVGENAWWVREQVCAGLNHLGIEVDADRNRERRDDARRISTDSSRVQVLVVPTNEELEIARQVRTLTAS